MAASTPLLKVLLALALVPVLRTLLGASRTGGTLLLPLGALNPYCSPQLFRLLEGELFVPRCSKSRISKALKTVHSPHRSPCLRPSIDQIRGVPSIGFPIGVMGSLWSGQDPYGRGGAVLGVGGRWPCSQEIHGTSPFYCVFVPHIIMGILS